MLCEMNSFPTETMITLLTAREAAQALRCGRNYLYGLCKEGKLRHLWVGNKILVPSDAIADFVNAQATGGS